MAIGNDDRGGEVAGTVSRGGAVLAVCLVLLLASIWFSSGTLAPYAATLRRPTVIGPCQYLFNIDHPHFVATFRFLQGADRAEWEWSVVLRRILYPILAFPFMTLWGFEVGGFITNVLLHVLAVLYFASYLGRAIGDQARTAALVLLSTYPGIAYWVGMPYSYAAIVPAMLVATVVLCKIDRAVAPATILGCSAVLGFISLAYDLLAYLAPATALLLVLRRKWLLVAAVLAIMALPVVVCTLVLSTVFSVAPGNANTNIYGTVIASYLNGTTAAGWWQLVRDIPGLLWHNWLYSNFIFLPALFVALLPVAWWMGVSIGRVEATVLCTALFLFLFNNLAPPYQGWQVRGTFIPRLYQPTFAVLILFCCRTAQAAARVLWPRRVVAALIVGAAVGNAAVTFGPALGLHLARHAYYNFYRHGPPKALKRNLERFGRRPLGICRTAQ